MPSERRGDVRPTLQALGSLSESAGWRPRLEQLRSSAVSALSPSEMPTSPSRDDETRRRRGWCPVGAPALRRGLRTVDDSARRGDVVQARDQRDRERRLHDTSTSPESTQVVERHAHHAREDVGRGRDLAEDRRPERARPDREVHDRHGQDDDDVAADDEDREPERQAVRRGRVRAASASRTSSRAAACRPSDRARRRGSSSGPAVRAIRPSSASVMPAIRNDDQRPAE